VSGTIVERHDLVDQDGFTWSAWVTRWDDDRLTVQFNTPNDPEHLLYGSDGPRFSLHEVRDAVSLRDVAGAT
jgi:hypothetical protein